MNAPVRPGAYAATHTADGRSLYAAVVGLARDGHGRREIADRLGKEHAESVRVYMTLARRRGDLPTLTAAGSRGPTRSVLTVRIPPELIDELGLEAEERGVSPADLVASLLLVIARDDLYEAVLGREGEA